MSPFLPHFQASHLAWDTPASAHYSLQERLPCIPVPHSVFGVSLEKNREEKLHVYVQPVLIDCPLAMKKFSVPIMSSQMTEAI